MDIVARLKHARARAGLTGAQVRQRTGIGESSLSEFENGKRLPSLSQLQALAGVYRRSIAFFLAEGAIPQETVLWRQRPSESAEEVEARFLRLCEQYRNLEMWVGQEAPVRLPAIREAPEEFQDSGAEELAKKVRRELQLGDRPGLTLLPVLEEACGVKVFHLAFEPTGTAASAVSEAFGAAVLLNARDVRWRRNHDLAHELFHLLTWDLFRLADLPPGGSRTETPRQGQLATCFARNLLMPPEATRTAVSQRLRSGRLPMDALYDIAREFDVSVESLLWHLHGLYRTPQDEERTRQDVRRVEAHRPPMTPRRETPPPVWPARYHALAVQALRRGEIAIGRFAEYLEITRQEALRYAEQEVTEDEEIQVTPA